MRGLARRVERLGFGTFWIGGNPSVSDVASALDDTSNMVIATGIINMWHLSPADVEIGWLSLSQAQRERCLLGIGAGHPELINGFESPVAKLTSYLNELDAAERPVPIGNRIIAALGPKMLALAAERSMGTHPYFVPPEHTRMARQQLGTGPTIAPEVAVVLDSNSARARDIARVYASKYLSMKNYRTNLLRIGYSEADLEDGGSDALIREIVPFGPPLRIAEVVRAHFDVGATHVCLQVLGNQGTKEECYEALAETLL
jgi:probable F420-dependent oxidoreductase